ncbi:MAG TPA: class I SAM-dependent methyltransferase [Anaerolineales bacterium]|nr:class I SAM-dependent methyltransferase [Anaerolineales bacterium]
MLDSPLTWHHGLIARWWAEFNTEGPEIAFFRTFLDRFGQPALDAACGTGRLLVPYLAAGIDIDGCDISQDMLDLCQQRARALGASPHLYCQALHEVHLPRLYRTIIVCGAFGLGVSRRQDQEGLNRMFGHLEPGGALLLDHELPHDWPYWSADARKKLPQEWAEHGERRVTSDGDELELIRRVAAFDPLDQAVTREVRALLWRDGRVVRHEEHRLLERLYFRNEVLLMLSSAGFRNVAVFSDYTRQPAAPDAAFLVYVATK